ncbi:choline dehydrogenase [Mesorhizobium soli]|uniref:GMC family oxidoreductase n=1 Tax=Pseudaminobacter soli (ex Li et al. 2025) TaxID=1295366 RepID=UPI002475F0DA|nr:GMC family oxidoreductase N-terminal domain-containing protein [Mesorhizobium soli]MDH6230772.1 choline dehydrogenase [Mesorhizobium soli]
MRNRQFPTGSWRDDMLDTLDRALLTGRIGRRQFMQWSVALGVSLAAVRASADELDDARSNQDARAANLATEYEVIVCGGGTAGCSLAGRLAEAGVSTLLIEAGDWDTAPSVLDPRQWFMNLGTKLDWGDIAAPSESVNGRAIPSHMAKVLGGGSSINATIWVRGHRNDYDGWAEAAGDPAWGYDNALEIFKRVENWQGTPDPKYRGAGGKVWVQPSQNPLPIAPAMLEAVKGLGMPVFDDLNGAREESKGGFALMNQIIKDGRRANMAQAYLYPVLARPNLTVLTRAHADRLVIEGGRVVGVEITRDGAPLTLHASREVVVSLGAIRSPKLLMLSGIGDRAHLAEHGIKARLHSPEVGQNFHDHILHGGCLWEAPQQMEYANSGANASGFWKSDAALDTPDLNIVQIELPYASEVVAKDYSPPATSWALCAGLVGPKSRGSVRLASARPADAPVVTANFLSHPDDVAALMKGIDLCRQIGNSPALAPWVKREVAPGRDLDSKAKADFVRNGATTFFHQVGTCRMGADDAAVVDAKLKLRGVEGLRVADGSIMPKIASCATMASCVFIGERMADILLSSE